MIRDLPADSNRITLTVTLLSGIVYANKDTPSQPFGDHDKFVAFWDDDDLITIPLNLVSKVKIHINNKEEK